MKPEAFFLALCLPFVCTSTRRGSGRGKRGTNARNTVDVKNETPLPRSDSNRVIVFLAGQFDVYTHTYCAVKHSLTSRRAKTIQSFMEKCAENSGALFKHLPSFDKFDWAYVSIGVDGKFTKEYKPTDNPETLIYKSQNHDFQVWFILPDVIVPVVYQMPDGVTVQLTQPLFVLQANPAFDIDSVIKQHSGETIVHAADYVVRIFRRKANGDLVKMVPPEDAIRLEVNARYFLPYFVKLLGRDILIHIQRKNPVDGPIAAKPARQTNPNPKDDSYTLTVRMQNTNRQAEEKQFTKTTTDAFDVFNPLALWKEKFGTKPDDLVAYIFKTSTSAEMLDAFVPKIHEKLDDLDCNYTFHHYGVSFSKKMTLFIRKKSLDQIKAPAPKAEDNTSNNPFLRRNSTRQGGGRRKSSARPSRSNNPFTSSTRPAPAPSASPDFFDSIEASLGGALPSVQPLTPQLSGGNRGNPFASPPANNSNYNPFANP